VTVRGDFVHAPVRSYASPANARLFAAPSERAIGGGVLSLEPRSQLVSGFGQVSRPLLRGNRLRMPDKKANVKNEKQYEGLRKKGMSKERAAKIANSPGASSRGGKKSGSKKS
jgi:hypothetical protein